MMSEQETERPPILLVDDEPEILSSLKGLLRREFTLHTAESGDQAMEILKNESIQVIMTDQRMPEMTGAELLNRARKVSADSIRIIFTGYADIKAVVDAVNHGQLYRYITKPWDPDDLVDTLREATEEYGRRQRRRQLFDAVQVYLDETLHQENTASNGEMRERGESLLSQIREEIQQADADHS